MAITVTHGPISSALRLAQKAGEGDEFWRRFTAERQLASEGLQRQSQAADMKATAIQQALAFQQQRQRQLEGQQNFALQAAQQRDLSQHRRQQAGLDERQMALREQQFGFETGPAFQQRQREAESLARYRDAYQPGGRAAFDPTKSPEYRAAEERIGLLQKRISAIDKQLDAVAPVNRYTGQRMTHSLDEKQMAQVRHLLDQRNKTAGDLGQLIQGADRYLSGTMPGFQAAGAAAGQAQVAQEAAGEVEQIAERVVRKVPNASLSDPASILNAIYAEVGRPETQQEAEVVAAIFNEIEQRLSK